MSNEILILMYIIWSVLIIFGILLEFLTPNFYLGWATGFSASAALITHAVSKKITTEIIVFIVCWLVLWIFLFIFANYFLKKRLHDSDDGYLSYIGKSYNVIKSNDKQGFGKITINDKEFRFMSKDLLKKGDIAKVIKISGVTFEVTKESKKGE